MSNSCLKCKCEIGEDRLYCDECLFKSSKNSKL